ncbi:MAG: metallophosphoesterase, partial [Bacteroidota bacterium]
FSNTQIVITAILASPLPAGYLLAANYRNANQKKASIVAKISAYLGLLAVIILGVFITENQLLPTGVFEKNSILGYSLILLIFIGIQSILSILFLFFSKRLLAKVRKEFPEYDIKIYPLRNVVPYFLLGIAIIGFLIAFRGFRFFAFVVYLLPNIYLYSHMRRAFSTRQQKNWFTIVFVVIAVLFPIGLLSHGPSDSFFLKYSLFGGYYYLPVLLYSFLLYLLFDIVRLVNWQIGFISKAVLTGKRFNRVLLVAILVITASIVAAGSYNFNNTKINHYSIDVPKKSSEKDQVKIAVAADFHLSEITSKKFVARFVEKIKSIDPDIILLPGDIIEGDQLGSKSEFFKKQYRKLSSKYEVYAVDGNHEIYMGEAKYEFFDGANIHVLRDSVVSIDNAFHLLGRRDRADKQRKPLTELLEHTSDSLPVIAMDHQPYSFEKVHNNNIDVQFSGHTHHGQMFPFQFITKSMYELSWGYKKINGTHFFVTSGAQGWGPPVKTSSPSEIMEIDVNFQSE